MKRRSRGFTLIELIASIVLASMMTAALMNIVWSVLRDMNRMKLPKLIDFRSRFLPINCVVTSSIRVGFLQTPRVSRCTGTWIVM